MCLGSARCGWPGATVLRLRLVPAAAGARVKAGTDEGERARPCEVSSAGESALLMSVRWAPLRLLLGQAPALAEQEAHRT